MDTRQIAQQLIDLCGQNPINGDLIWTHVNMLQHNTGAPPVRVTTDEHSVIFHVPPDDIHKAKLIKHQVDLLFHLECVVPPETAKAIGWAVGDWLDRA